jgi:hypothetical protein
MSLLSRIMASGHGTAIRCEQESGMVDHNGVLTVQRLLLAGTLGLAMAQKAAEILDVRENPGDPADEQADRGPEGAVLRAILDAANECLGHFDDRPPSERWCDTMLHLLDLAAFASELG